MKSRFILPAIGIVLALVVSSCRDEFTEEDALKAQQEIDLAIFVNDFSDPGKPPVMNAEVIISQGDQSITQSTNENGIVFFENVRVGGLVYIIKAENYVTITGETEIDPTNFRVSQSVLRVGTYSLNDPTKLATIKGRITIETDVTNITKEYAENVPVTLTTTVNEESFTFTDITDADGKYEIVAPVFEGVTSYILTVPDLERDQTVAVNKFEDEQGSFFTSPQVLPRIEQVPTVFSVFRNSSDPDRFDIPDFSVRSVYAIADPAPTGGRTATVTTVFTDVNGAVTSFFIQDGGDYTGDADDMVKIEVFSLDGGSGAVLQVPLGGVSNLNTAFINALGNGSITFPVGSGYPILNNNFTLNKIRPRLGSHPTIANGLSFINLVPGSLIYQDLDYGTGITRERVLN